MRIIILKNIEESDCWPDIQTAKEWIDRIKSTYDDYNYSVIYFYVDKKSDIYEVDLDVAQEYMKDSKSLYDYPIMLLSAYHHFYDYNRRIPFWKKMIITTILYSLYMPMEFIDHTWAKINARRPIYMFPKPRSPREIINKHFHRSEIKICDHEDEVVVKECY